MLLLVLVVAAETSGLSKALPVPACGLPNVRARGSNCTTATFWQRIWFVYMRCACPAAARTRHERTQATAAGPAANEETTTNKPTENVTHNQLVSALFPNNTVGAH